MFTKKTKLQLCAKNLTSVERDLVDVTYPTDLVGAINNGAGYAIGTAALTVDGFSGGNVPTGCIVGIAGDPTTYYVSTGGSATSITVDPPLKYAVLDNAVVTIYPHFDITAYWTNDVEIGQQAEFTQAEMIFDRPIKIELFNQNSIFYDRDTHSTGWSSTTAYFSTYNAQADTDNQYIRISLKRNGTWYQKYNGKIIQHTLELDEINHKVSFECESVFYGLKDNLVAQIDGLYNLHKYTTTTRKTKTPSGFYVGVIKTLFQSVGIQDKAFTVTNKEKSYNFIADTYNYCVLTIGAHTIQPGELIAVSIGDLSFDGTFIVYSVTSTTITYYFDSSWEYFKDDVNATVAAGNSAVVLQTGLGSGYDNFYGKCKFATADTTIYDFTYTHSTKTITLDPVLSNEATINEDVFLSCPKLIASGAASGTVTAHRIYFDSATDYFNVTHQGHSYNLFDLMWITEKWMVQDVEAETGFNLIAELCQQLLALACIDYKAGIAYGYFRSKLNTSASKFTISTTAGAEPIAAPRLMGNWPFYSSRGIAVNCDIVYWNQGSQASEFCYAEDLGAGDYQRYLDETPSSSVLAYERYATTINAATFNNLAEGDRIFFLGDDTIYKITDVSSETITINPPLVRSVKLGQKFAKVPDSDLSLKYANCCNLKLKYPNIFLTDTTAKTVRRYWNNGTATLGIHPMSYYTSEVIYTDSNETKGVAWLKLSPVADGRLSVPCGDSLIYTENGAAGSLKTLVSKSSFPADGIYVISEQSGATAIVYYKIVSGFIYGKDETNNSTKLYRVAIINVFDTDSPNPYQISMVSIEMDDAGDTASVYVRPRNTSTRRNFAGGRNANPANLPPRLQGTQYTAIRNGRSSVTVNANEFGYYKLTVGTNSDAVTIVDGYIGTSNTVYSMFLNHDVLNPDYDDKIYADAEHADCIRKLSVFNASAGFAVFTGTPPTAGTVLNFIVNHGEGANQEYYWYNSSDFDIYKNTGADWSDAVSVFSGSTGIGNHIAKWDKQDLSYQIGGTLNFRKCYDNILVVADMTELTLSLMDIDNSRTFCIEDTAVLDSIGDIDIQCFTNWWDYQGATNATIFENDICFNASKLAYKFYSKNRRPYECRMRDVDLGYIDYTLFDRMTISSNILSAASGSPKFYVYGYSIDCRTHDHKLTLLESVE